MVWTKRKEHLLLPISELLLCVCCCSKCCMQILCVFMCAVAVGAGVGAVYEATVCVVEC